MRDQNFVPAEASDPQRFLPMLLLLFAGSGCSALIYEIIWFQMLQLVVGSTAVSLGVLLGTFMGGMCLGSLLLARVVSARRHPLRVYAFLELGIGAIGLAILYGLPFVDRIYVAQAGHGTPAIVLRAVVSAICLLPPTLLMGATLPAVARWIKATPRGISWLGFFYGGNIAGAVFGCLLAGFVLLRIYDIAAATYAAAALNALVAVAALALARRTNNAECGMRNAELNAEYGAEDSSFRIPHSAFRISVYVAIALSGMSALSAEVVWTRLLSLLMGGTVYTFSIILAVFLVGLGIGSSVGSYLSLTAVRPRLALGTCQLLLALAIAWTAYMISSSLPYWPVQANLAVNYPWQNFQLDLARCCWAILPATILWGASFPLALAAAATPGRDPGRLVGEVYAANTVGAIVGSLATSLVLVAWLGTRNAQRVMVATAVLSGLLMFAPLMWHGRLARDPDHGQDDRATFRPFVAGLLVVAALWAALLAARIPETPWGLVAYGRYMPTYLDQIAARQEYPLYVGEGMNSSVAVTESVTGERNFHVSGKVEASNLPKDMRLQRTLGHLPALLHKRPESVLIVGCGAGVTAGSFTLYPSIKRIVICDIEPLIPKKIAPFFIKENYDVVNNPRVKVVYDDARHYVLTMRDKFDIITSDPIHPWVKGAATLYTEEYFRMVKEHLNPGGIVTQWVPLYESSEAVVKSEMATFFKVFPNGTIWRNDEAGQGYDVFLLGQNDPMKIDLDALQKNLDSPGFAQVKQSIADVGFHSAVDLLSIFAGQAGDLKRWLADAQINQDRNLRLQYLAGLENNNYKTQKILDDFLVYLSFPKEMFTGSETSKQALRAALRVK